MAQTNISLKNWKSNLFNYVFHYAQQNLLRAVRGQRRFRTCLGLNTPERFGKLSVRARQAVYKAVTGTSGARKIFKHFLACGTVISYTCVFQYIHDK